MVHIDQCTAVKDLLKFNNKDTRTTLVYLVLVSALLNFSVICPQDENSLVANVQQE